MKAIVWTNYGPPDVLQLKELEKPTPKDDEVLIKIFAATVSTGDCELRSFKFGILLALPLRILVGVIKPTRRTILGQELAGEIEAVGQAVTRFKKGDQIFAPTQLRLGAYAEYVCLPESYPSLKPISMTYEEAATIPIGGSNGLLFVKIAKVQSGQRVLINGAGGCIGTYTVQIAKAFGAEVTAVDSAGKLDMLRSIGADRVIDYTREDFTRQAESYDVIIDTIGKSSFSRSVRALKPNGRYILGNPSLPGRIRGSLTPMTAGKKVITATASFETEGYTFLKELIEAGKIKSVIDRCYPLEQTAEAHRYVDTGHKRGSVVITVEQNNKI
jgi:NADPH:quinone reductase-like Zn-dependent oxidoreductase